MIIALYKEVYGSRSGLPTDFWTSSVGVMYTLEVGWPMGSSSAIAQMELSDSLENAAVRRRFPQVVPGWGCSPVGRASDRHAADAGSIPRCGKEFFI